MINSKKLKNINNQKLIKNIKETALKEKRAKRRIEKMNLKKILV